MISRMDEACDHDSEGSAMPGMMPASYGVSEPGVAFDPLDEDGSARWVATGDATDLPAWLADAVAEGRIEREERRFDTDVTERTTRFGRVRSAVVQGAGRLDDDAFEDAVARAYDAVLADLESTHLLRAWNFVPQINDPASVGDDGLERDRYMVFNAGRFRAFTDVFGTLEWFPVASGVGPTRVTRW